MIVSQKMIIRVYLLAFVALFMCVFISQGLDVDGSEQEDCVDELDAVTSEIDSEAGEGSTILIKHIGVAMRLGNWVCAKEIVQLGQKNEIINADLKNIFELEQRSIVKEIAALRTAIESSLPMSVVAPAFQWAQTPKEILLNIKFSHKIDAPATLNVEVTNITTLASSFILHASDGRKNFKLNIELLREVIPEETRYDMGSVGRMTVTLTKALQPKKWNRLTKSKEKKNHMHVWWEMAEKYKAEVDRLEDDDDDSESTKKKKTKGTTASTSTTASTATEDSSGKDSDDNSAMPATATTTTNSDSSNVSETLKKIDKETKEELQATEDEGKKKKQEIDAKLKVSKAELDAKAKEEKKKIDIDILDKKQSIERAAKIRKQLASSPGADKATSSSSNAAEVAVNGAALS